MAIKMVSVRCPDCGASLDVEEGRTQLFCSYCGAKVIIQNDNEYIYRTIDDAEVKQAETQRMVMLKQLEMEEKAKQDKKGYIRIWLGATAILFLLGIIGIMRQEEYGYLCLLLDMSVGMMGVFFIDGNKKKTPVIVNDNQLVISNAMTQCRNKDYRAAVSLFRAAGFTNISEVPLKDLTFFSRKDNGKVADVAINGNTEFEENDVVLKTARITITYHSK